jgi:hypothetical protein
MAPAATLVGQALSALTIIAFITDRCFQSPTNSGSLCSTYDPSVVRRIQQIVLLGRQKPRLVLLGCVASVLDFAVTPQ